MDRIARLPAGDREALFLETASRKRILKVVIEKSLESDINSMQAES